VRLRYNNFIFRRFFSWNSKQQGSNPLKNKGRSCSAEVFKITAAGKQKLSGLHMVLEES